MKTERKKPNVHRLFYSIKIKTMILGGRRCRCVYCLLESEQDGTVCFVIEVDVREEFYNKEVQDFKLA
jgi:hypothetical protein